MFQFLSSCCSCFFPNVSTKTPLTQKNAVSFWKALHESNPPLAAMIAMFANERLLNAYYLHHLINKPQSKRANIDTSLLHRMIRQECKLSPDVKVDEMTLLHYRERQQREASVTPATLRRWRARLTQFASQTNLSVIDRETVAICIGKLWIYDNLKVDSICGASPTLRDKVQICLFLIDCGVDIKELIEEPTQFIFRCAQANMTRVVEQLKHAAIESDIDIRALEISIGQLPGYGLPSRDRRLRDSDEYLLHEPIYPFAEGFGP